MPKIARLLRKVRTIQLTTLGRVTLGGSKYLVPRDISDVFVQAITGRNTYDPGMQDIFRILLNLKGGVFIDVGANIGQTLVNVLEVSRDIQYLGCEPQLACAASIDRFITLNNLHRHVILPIGLGNRNGIASFGFREENDPTASMIEGYRPTGFYRYYRHLPVHRGDHILDDLGVSDVAILKVDVEGGELEVLQGFYNSLENHRPTVIFEILPNRLLTTGQALDGKTKAFREQRHGEMEVLFRTLNYEFYAIQADGSMLKVEELTASNQVNLDYLAVPKEHNEKFVDLVRSTIPV